MELFLEDRSAERVVNLTGATQSVSWETGRRPTAGKLEVRYTGNPYPLGSFLTLQEQGKSLFSGRVFVTTQGREGELRLVAYDQLRQFKVNDSMVRKDMTLDGFVSMACATLSLRVGTLAPTGLILPRKVYDGKEWLASLEDSIRETNYLTGAYYCLFDDGGAVTLRELEELRLPLILGDGSLAYDFEAQSSLEEAANRVKLVVKKTGGIYLFEDSDRQEDWGVLQHYEALQDGYNDTQIRQLGKALLAVKNRSKEGLSLSCLGDSRVRGGSGVRVILSELSLDSWLLVEKATHNWSGGEYTMKLELGVYG